MKGPRGTGEAGLRLPFGRPPPSRGALACRPSGSACGLRIVVVLGAIVLGAIVGGAAAAAPAERPHVVFIAVDDLRPDLGCYGVDTARTPCLDRFARSARIFRHHFVQVPTCGASRFALWTGRYPRERSALDNGAFVALRRPSPGVETLPALFRRAGYRSVSIGKVSHSPDGLRRDAEGRGDGLAEMPESWDRVGAPSGRWGTAWDAFFAYADGTGRRRGQSPPLERGEVTDDGYPDAGIAAAAVEELRAAGDTPLFLAVGFYKPHLPFNSPASYWRLHESTADPLPAWPRAPWGTRADLALHSSGELLGNYGSHPRGRIVDETYAARLRLAYRSAVSYVDAQIGKVLDEIDRAGIADRTIVVVWGDHGWHLGEHGIWGKHTVLERSLRSVLMIRSPGLAAPGASTDAVVETVDLYPTLAALCGLSTPSRLDGRDLSRLLEDPAAAGRGRALGFWRRGRHLARTVRTDRFRLVEWTREGKLVARELYDHELDPEETVNLTLARPDVVAELSRLLTAEAPAIALEGSARSR